MHNDTDSRMTLTAGGLSGSSAFMRALACAALVAMLSLALTACKSTICHLPAEPINAESLAGDWYIASVYGEEVAPLLQDGGRTPAVTINADGTISGFTGVNRVNGSVDAEMLARGKWVASPMATTRMAGEPGMMALEQKILSALQSADTVMHTGGSVVLAKAGEPVLTLTPANR